MIFELVQDFADVLEAMPADHPRRRILSLLDEAIRRDVHFIEQHPTTLFQCLWNSCWWYDCATAGEHYSPPRQKQSGWRGLWDEARRTRYESLQSWEKQRGWIWLRDALPTLAIAISLLGERLESWWNGLWGGRREVPAPAPAGNESEKGSNPWEQPDRPLSRLLERWREAIEQELPTRMWLRCLRPPAVPLGTVQRAVFGGHQGKVYCVSFAPDGRRIASGSNDQTIRVWDVQSGAERDCLSVPGSIVKSLHWSPDGRRLVMGLSDGTVRVADVAEGTELLCFRGHGEGVQSVRWSPDGRYLASGSEDKTVRVVDARSGAEHVCLRGHTGSISSVDWSPDGRFLVSASSDATVRIWDVQSGTERLCFRGHGGSVDGASWSPDGRSIISFSTLYHNRIYPDGRSVASYSGSLRVWDAETGGERICFQGHESGVRSVNWSPDSRRIASGSWDTTTRVYDAQTGKELLCFRGHDEAVWSVSWSPDGRHVASGSEDKTVRLWDTQGQASLPPIQGHAKQIGELRRSPDGQRLASSSADTTVRIWDAQTGLEQLCLRGHLDTVTDLSWSPESRRLASFDLQGKVKIWDARSGAELFEFEGKYAGKSWSPDGRHFVVEGRTLRVLKARSGVERATLKGFSGPPSVAWSPDGRRLAGSSRDHVVCVWDVTSGVELLRLPGHEDVVGCLSWSPDGDRLASGSHDRTARIWDAGKGIELFCLRGHEHWVARLAWSPDGRLLVSASLHGTVRVWDASTGTCLEVIPWITDVNAIAAGARADLCEAHVRGLVTVIADVGAGEVAARFPVALDFITSHPGSHRWAGCAGSQLYVIALEGKPDQASG
jgi:WD40 repeat protein